MSASETSANGRRDFLQTVLAAPVLVAALADQTHSELARREIWRLPERSFLAR
jgi:hypothetical protein